MKKRLTIIQAVLQVMKEAGVPLAPKSAHKLIIKRKLYSFIAQNPEHVVNSLMRRHCQGLDFPSAEPKKYFRLEHGGKMSPLPKPIIISGRVKKPISRKPKSKSGQNTLAANYEAIFKLLSENEDILKEKILGELRKLTPEEFEIFGGKLIKEYGFEDVKVTPKSRDGGIDGFGKLRVGLAHMEVAFQCKRWNASSVGRKDISQFRGDIQGKYEQGIFFTTAKFTSEAKEASFQKGAVPIILIDGAAIVKLMIDKRFGVQSDPVFIHTYALDMVISDSSDGSSD